MALSNIFREPRRELTESTIGILLIGGFLWGDYRYSVWFNTQKGGTPDIIGGMLLGFGIFLIIVCLALVSHWVGEWVCDKLAELGLELRPRRRY